MPRIFHSKETAPPTLDQVRPIHMKRTTNGHMPSDAMIAMLETVKPTTSARCAFLAFTCPSNAVARPLAAVLARLPQSFVAIHFRTVGHRAHGSEADFLRALSEPIPPASKARGLLDHAIHLDKVLTARCKLAKDTWTKTQQSACHCERRLESLFSMANQASSATPVFFSTDLLAVAEYAQTHLAEWVSIAVYFSRVVSGVGVG